MRNGFELTKMKTVPAILSDDYLFLHRKLYDLFRQRWGIQKTGLLKKIWKDSLQRSADDNPKNLLHDLLFDLKTAAILVDEIGLKQAVVCAVLMFRPVMKGHVTIDEIRRNFGEEVAIILRGLKKVNDLTEKKSRVESENYIKLLLSIAEDIRVVFVLLAEQLQSMRDAKGSTPEKRLDLSVESTYLYAPLAHRLGLYTIKSELEDLSLKYTDRETYDFIARKLNESKRSRDKYIDEFILPLKERLDKTNLKYDIKGRTKSIHSINSKLKKQKIEFDNIYDLFAIRIILDSPSEMEKAHCWQVYSIVTDMYQPNPKRLKDWLSIPKSNGYESLHITVMGPESKWVEVQIRTRRMDDIAERGLAAHWKYKGVKEESTLDDWLKSLRESLENKDVDIRDRLGDFKLDLYDEEIFVFTPKGDLFKLPKGASVLDFAFAIHSKLGATCVSGKVNGKNVPIKQVDIAKEMLSRRMKNRKIDLDDPLLMQLIKKLKYKTVTDFYIDIAAEKLEINWVIDRYLELGNKDIEHRDFLYATSADSFVLKPYSQEAKSSDELIIDQNLTGVDYRLAKCCNPIYGDEIFGFVSSQGIKIHRISCPNSHDLFSRFGYRILKARWSGKTSGAANYTSVLRIIGNDQLNIVANLMSIISKEDGVQMRSISIDSNDGLFQGNITVMLASTSMLEQLIKKLKAVKGVKSVSRLN